MSAALSTAEKSVDGKILPLLSAETAIQIVVEHPVSGLKINVAPLFDLIEKYAGHYEVSNHTGVLNLVLADIGSGLNCDQKYEPGLVADANRFLWEISKVFNQLPS